MSPEPNGFKFNAIDSSLLFSRGDAADPRFGELTKALPSSNSLKTFETALKNALDSSQAPRPAVLAGYPDDEGIRLNGGRPGACNAPTEVRRSLYKMTPSLLRAPDLLPLSLIDVGDLDTKAEIKDRHENASLAGLTALKNGALWIGIGGGHDYGYPDAAAFCRWCKEENPEVRPLVINFDAHLDVRPVSKGLSSGTPFFRMLEKFPDVDFAEIGIQAHCNSSAHLEWVKSKGAKVLTQEQLEVSGESMATVVTRTLGDWILRHRPVFISIDIDGFSSAVAPGCSQSWATGFMPDQFFPCLSVLTGRLDVRALGIYEVSPPLDHDNRTAKLAAQIIHRVISA